VFRFAFGGIKFGDRPTAAAPSEGTSVDIGTVTPEEGSLAPIVQSDGSVTMLRITDIQPCEKNPRHTGWSCGGQWKAAAMLALLRINAGQ
jgi:hypothetical protein